MCCLLFADSVRDRDGAAIILASLSNQIWLVRAFVSLGPEVVERMEHRYLFQCDSRTKTSSKISSSTIKLTRETTSQEKAGIRLISLEISQSVQQLRMASKLCSEIRSLRLLYMCITFSRRTKGQVIRLFSLLVLAVVDAVVVIVFTPLSWCLNQNMYISRGTCWPVVSLCDERLWCACNGPRLSCYTHIYVDTAATSKQ